MSNVKRRGTDRPWFSKGGRHGFENRISDFKQWAESLPSEYSIIDIGAAEGDVACWFAERFSSITAVERFDNLYKSLCENLSAFNNTTCIKADILYDHLQQEADVVLLLGVLHYFNNPADRATVINKCLSAANNLLVGRVGIREFRKINEEHKRWSDYPSLLELKKLKTDGWNLLVLDNNERPSQQRLGDLFIYIRKIEGEHIVRPENYINGLIDIEDAIKSTGEY